MMKRVASLLLCVMLVITMCAPVYAQEGSDTSNQIVDGGGENKEHSNLATVSKTIKKTDTENVFEITLTVETPIKVEQVKVEQSAAVVVVIDNSGSMGNGSVGTRLYNAKQAARSFVQSFANVNGNANARRMVAVVEFDKEAQIKKLQKGDQTESYYYWFDVTNEDALEAVAGNGGLIDGISNGAGTSIEAGLLLGQNLLNHFWKKENVYGWANNKKDTYWNSINDSKNPIGKNIVFLTDGVTICRIKDGVTYDQIKELDELKQGEAGQISGNDICYADDRYTYDSYETEGGKIKINDNGTPVLKSETNRTKFHYKNAPYTATHQLIETANAIRDTDVTLFGIAVDMPEIYVEKTAPTGTTSATAHQNEDEIIKYHITASESSSNSAYDYYPSTTDWMASHWCDFAYPASNNIPELNSAFSSVLANTVPTWKVEDKLPDYISLVGDNNDPDKAATWSGNTLTWDLQNSKKTTSGGKETYTYTYTVSLDPTKITDKDLNPDGSVNTNVLAKLPANTQQGVNNETPDTNIEFPHPTVKSDPATIKVIKIDNVTGLPLPNATFKLEGRTTSYTGTGNNYGQEKSTVSVTENDETTAVVSFNDVTGGSYTLTESAVPAGYAANSDRTWEFNASFGTITAVEPSADFVISGDKKTATMTLANTRQTGSLTISNKEDEEVSVVIGKIDRDKTFAFDVVFHTQEYYGSNKYVALANKTYQAVLTDENGNPSNIEISTDGSGKAWIKTGDAELTPFTLGLDDSIVINGLPVGTQFTIKETPFEYFDLTGITAYDKSVQIGSEEYDYLGTVMLDNSESTEDESAPNVKFINTRKTGSVKVSKATVDKMLTSTEQFPFKLVVDGGEAYPNVRMLTGVYGTYHEDGAESGAQTISIQHQTEAGKEISVSEFTLSDLDYAIIGKLPVGFAYTVTEEMTQAQAEAYTGSVAVTNETEDGKIAADKTPEYAFTNTYRSGSLIIEKRVEGNGAHNSKDFTFKVVLGDENIHSAYDTDNDPDTVNNGGRIVVKRLSPAKPDGEEETVEFDQGTAYVTLKPGERLVFSGVPTETENKLSAQVVELSDAEVRVLKGKLMPDADADADEDNTQDSEDEDDAQQVEEALQADPDYGKDGYADYEVMVNGMKSAVAEGEIVENGENSEPMTALYTNIRRVGDLTIRKEVGEAGDYDGVFEFEVTVTSDRIRADQINGWYGDLWFRDGVAKFKLGHEQSVTARELPADAKYSIVEDPKGHIQAGDSPTGTIKEGERKTVNIINWLPFLPGTGDNSSLALMVALFICSTAGFALLSANRRRSRMNS